ncbi:uncharacterized protein LOC135343102 [Halichondria panicea]|uniref:uncharacterized protein LOC135343102 n=1 Tax=Halichondria panicea TaxID=6063 RepID=UPI00312B38EC
MASYHLEALRRQRLIDRAHQAAHTVDHEIPAADIVQYTSKQGSQGSRESIRPKSASSIAQTMSATIEIGNDSCTVSRHTSRPASAISSKSVSSQAKSSRPASAKTTPTSKTRSQGNSISSRRSSRPASASSSHTKTSILSPEGGVSAATQEPSEGTRSLSSSRATKVTISESGTAGKSRSISAASKQSWSSRAEIRADEVRKELHKQELFLRDSNLVMGDIQVEEELQLTKKELQLV